MKSMKSGYHNSNRRKDPYTIKCKGLQINIWRLFAGESKQVGDNERDQSVRIGAFKMPETVFAFKYYLSR